MALPAARSPVRRPRRADKVVGCVDQRQMRKRLRKVAKLPSGGGVVFFRQQSDVVAQRQEPLEQGFGLSAPWLARVLIAPFIKNSILTKGMKAGYKLPGASLAPASDLMLPAALDAMRSAVARYENEPQRAPHPFFGMLASQEYTSLHLRHSELHMSFVLPEGS